MLSGSIDPHFTVAGFLVGALVGVTGVGGGSLMTPILILLFGVSPATAVGTDLLFAAVTKTVGSIVHGYNETIDWRVVRRLAIGSIPATALALIVLASLNAKGGGAHGLITGVLSIALLLTAGVFASPRRRLGERQDGQGIAPQAPVTSDSGLDGRNSRALTEIRPRHATTARSAP